MFPTAWLSLIGLDTGVTAWLSLIGLDTGVTAWLSLIGLDTGVTAWLSLIGLDTGATAWPSMSDSLSLALGGDNDDCCMPMLSVPACLRSPVMLRFQRVWSG